MNKSVSKKFVAALVLSLWLGIVFGSHVFSAGDGNLLRRTNQDENTCGGPNNACHNLKPHNATNTGSTYWTGDWGNTSTSKYGKFVCQTCHTPHSTKNIYLIREKIKFPDASTMPSGLTESPVDLRALSAATETTFPDANYVLGNDNPSASGRPTSSTRVCEVCHSQTAHHRYNTSSQTDGLTHNNALACVMCHMHAEGFKKPGGGTPGSEQNANCQLCHSIQWNAMNGSDTSKYNMYLTGTDWTTYPTQSLFTDTDTESANRKCIMCHARMGDFSPASNFSNSVQNRSMNLRRSINITPDGTTATVSDTDFIADDVPGGAGESISTAGGICTSCHQNSQYKKNVSNDTVGQGQTDADTMTPAGVPGKTPQILPALFKDSPHNYQVQSASFGDGNTFKANCLKCHNEYPENGASKMTGAGTKFAPHSSTIRRLNAPMSLTLDYGTSTGGSSTTLADTSKTWTTNTWKGRPVTIVAGTGKGQTRLISSNTNDTLTLSSAWTTAPDATSKYSVGDPAEEEFCFNCHSTTRNPNYAIKKDFYGVQTVQNGKMFKMEDMFRTYTGTGGVGNNADTVNCPIAVSSTNTSLVVTPSPGWTGTGTSGQWAGSAVRITAGTGVGQIKRIVGSGANYICLSADWTTAPLSASTFEIGQIRHRIDTYTGVHRTDESINAPANATAAGWFASVSGGTHSGCTDCHNPHAQKKSGEDNGTASAGSATSLTDTSKSGVTAWTTDQWRGYNLRLMDGTGAGQDRMIVANSANALTVGAGFTTAPASGTYYVIVPAALPGKGNNLSGPNNGQWGVDIDYGTTPPAIGSYANPTYTKNTSLVSGTDKIYELCFKCHSDYGWGNGGTPFNIVDSISSTYTHATGIFGSIFATASSTNIAKEFNPNNLGYHPVVDIGENQPITAMGNTPENIQGPFTSGTNTLTSVAYSNTWTPNQYSGNCIEIAGQIRSIESHTTTAINVDPDFITTAPAAGSTFNIRKCSIYYNGANYDLGTPVAWPRFTGGTISLTAGSNTATITSLANGIPSTVIPGWYIYAGTLYTAANNNVMPNVGSCSLTAPCPPTLATTGWFQITAIGPDASQTGQTTVTLSITPTPTADYSGSYSMTAGLGNNFVPPFGPWSVIACTDCHDTDNSSDPSGPHGSAAPWILRRLEAQSFPWFRGGMNATTSTTNALDVITVGYPDGKTAWPVAVGDMSNYFCLNCHRADVYGYEDNAPFKGNTAQANPTGAGFTNFSWRIMSRVPHIPDTGGQPLDGGYNIYGINCMTCHGGDARVSTVDAKGINSTTQPANEGLGGLHGSNQGRLFNTGTGSDVIGSGGISGYRGRRLLNGATWVGVTRATTATAVYCWTKKTADGISSCTQGHTGTTAGHKANYPYYSGQD